MLKGDFPMLELFRSLVVHQAQVHRGLFDAWGTDPAAPRTEVRQVDLLVQGLVHDGVWLSKFPVQFTPTYGVLRLDALNKACQASPGTDLVARAAEVRDLRTRLDADLLRFVLSLKSEAVVQPVEIFYSGRAMNKPLWQYLISWWEQGSVLRGRLGNIPPMTETVFR
jgi:hypothetical protein